MALGLTNIADILKDQRERRSEQTALVFEGERWSYGRLDEQVDRFAAALDASGFPADGVVAIYLDSLPELVIGYLGTLRAGRVANIINGSLKAPEAHFILDDSESRLLVTDVGRSAALGRLEPLPYLERIVQAGHDFAKFLGDASKRVDAPDTPLGRLSTLMYTSGTTGRPKGVMLSHLNIIDNATRFGRIHFTADDRLVIGAPVFHCWGLINGLLGVFAAGGTAIIMRRFQTDAACELVHREQATQFLGVAAMYNFMLKSPWAKEGLASLKCVHSAAAPTPVELIAKLRGEFGIEYAESYGLTETSPVITTAPYALTKPGSCGKAMGDTELQVVSADGRVLGTGEIGELWARGTAIMLGYWRRPDATAEAITPDGWFKTGDIVRMDSDGYIYIVDRQKDMINVAGEKVYPREVEEVLYGHPAVGDATVVGIPHPDKGEAPKAYIVVKAGATLEREQIVAYCKERLASFKVPYEVEFVDEIPRSASGKILRRLLREEESGRAG